MANGSLLLRGTHQKKSGGHARFFKCDLDIFSSLHSSLLFYGEDVHNAEVLQYIAEYSTFGGDGNMF